jgi:hypothetical protein
MRVATKDSEPWIREMALGALARYRFDPQVIELETRALNDPDQTVQVRAASYLTWLVYASSVTPFNPKAGESAVTLPDTGLPSDARLDDPTRFDLSAIGTPKREAQDKALNELLVFFKKYGDGCTRSDADWGWRSVGNAILCYGNNGRAELQKIIDADQDKRLAELAWRVVYIEQHVMSYTRCTPEQDAVAHQHRPAHMLSDASAETH